MNKEIIDMHCHLLPGVDDGAKDESDCMLALRMAAKQGIKKIIVTPHFCPAYRTDAKQIIMLTEKINEKLHLEGLDMQLYPGMECLYSIELPNLLEQKIAMPLANSRYVLVEFLEQSSYLYIKKGLESIASIGFVPILAHYERYPELRKENRVKKLKESGFLLQMNYETICQHNGWLKKNPFLKDLKKGYVDFLGSDCHGSQKRKYDLDPAIQWVQRNLSKSLMERMMYENCRMIIDHEYK